MAGIDSWRIGYARQALSDLDARETLLRNPKLPDCQHLHFLQMACKKICKAFLCGRGVDPGTLQGSHAYIAKHLPLIVRQQLAISARHLPRDGGWIVRGTQRLARQIELLSPAVDDAGRHPANCEYPWEGPAGRIIAPVEYRFEIDLRGRVGKHLLKCLYAAAADLITSAINIAQ